MPGEVHLASRSVSLSGPWLVPLTGFSELSSLLLFLASSLTREWSWVVTKLHQLSRTECQKLGYSVSLLALSSDHR